MIGFIQKCAVGVSVASATLVPSVMQTSANYEVVDFPVTAIETTIEVDTTSIVDNESFVDLVTNYTLSILDNVVPKASAASTVTSDGIVTVDPATMTEFGDGIANMAGSLLSVAMTLIPYLLSFIAVTMIIGFVKGFIKRR